MKKLLFTILTAITILQYSAADSVIVGTVKDSVTGSNILSGSIEFVPIDTPKTNSNGDLLFGYKTIAYINNGKFSATLTEGLYDCVIGPFNITKPITVPAGDNVINLATIYGNTDNSLVTFFQFYTLSNALASMITGSVSGVATFNGRSGVVTLASNDVYAVDIAAEKIKFTSDSYVHDTNVLAFAVLSVDSELSAATNSRSLIVQSLGVDPATNAVNSITNEFATKAYVDEAVISVGSMDYSITNHFATTNYVVAAAGEAMDYTDTAILNFLNNTLSDAATTPISTIISGLATTTYVNTSTNGFITTANAQALTNNFATKVYAESLTNNFATTNFVKNYVDSLTVTNSGDSSISLSNITAVYILSIKSNTTIAPFLNVSASEFRSASLFITNGVGSNCTVKLPDGTSCLGGTTLTVTNAQRRIISVGGFINFTNAVSQALP